MLFLWITPTQRDNAQCEDYAKIKRDPYHKSAKFLFLQHEKNRSQRHSLHRTFTLG